MARLATIRQFLEYRKVEGERVPESALYRALADFPAMGRLINRTMKQAVPVAELGNALFAGGAPGTVSAAANTLMALGSAAREDGKAPGLLPCRVHSFFRGLAGLWICMDVECAALGDMERDGICGRMYSQPRDSCECGARVLELYTCRNCGTAYARAYADDIDGPDALWAEPGESLRMAEGETSSLRALDLLLEEPALEDVAEPADYDLETGRLNPASLGSRTRRVYIRSDRVSEPTDEDEGVLTVPESRGQFAPCAVCGRKARFGRSYVQDHQTKGDQPFQAVVARQLDVQPPSSAKATAFAPLQGRKVLTFSDSRQVAARLAPNLQMYSTRDSLRPLIAWGYRRLQAAGVLRQHLSLEDLYLAALLGSEKLNVRLRPEVKQWETFAVEQRVQEAVASGAAEDDAGLLDLCFEVRNARPPEALLDQIVTTVRDRFLGLEPLALASIAERSKHTEELQRMPAIAGVAETPSAKRELARAWLRCWQSRGFWLGSMPSVWWGRPRSEGTSIRGQKGWFRAMDVVLADRVARKAFREGWLSTLLALFTEEMGGGQRRLRGNDLTLLFDGAWARCDTCKSVHRPVSGISHCLDCGGRHTRPLDPDRDAVFLARKGFYRNPVTAALGEQARRPIALVAAEHTAQLNAPQNEDVFSKAEENELLFQDIAVNAHDPRSSAIDVLSSTTTMEVGIDIGALSAVALRNMPPSRANYQQRSGRAGRRGRAVATVVAFGSADSHDEHYFSEPDGMIRGNVVDPRLTLDNREIVRRHIRAYLLQNYHQDRIPRIDPGQRHDLFSVLGTVSGFRSGASILNRDDFAAWLRANAERLRGRVSSWIPEELGRDDRDVLLGELVDDCIGAVDDAIGQGAAERESGSEADEGLEPKVGAEGGDERARVHAGTEKLLDRLLYCGKLPRYAFPTDVATFHVFDLERSSRFRPIMRFAPQQGLPIALTQYAPGKQVWIAGKCYTSGAVYSVNPEDRYGAWRSKRIYMECGGCGFASTYPIEEATRNETRDCQACGGEQTFGPGRYWLRPPGFAHPVDAEELTSPDDMPEISYATRAKLTMDTPKDEAAWLPINHRTRVLPSRQHLLVSNTGPRKDGYTYCVKCGRIEASTERSPKVSGPHRKPYPDDDDKRECDGGHPSRHVVLGTDFITDIALFSMRVAPPVSLKPGHTSTMVALRTLSEALAKAACRLLELEPGELMAEYRPALTTAGKAGLEAEIFLYDTLPGGAGFSTELAGCGAAVFEAALSLLRACPEGCDSSCYRCLRSFKNKLEHSLLDRHIGAQLAAHLLSGELVEFSRDRLRSSTSLLYNDLCRQSPRGVRFSMDATMSVGDSSLKAPILAAVGGGRRFVVALSAPLTPGHAADAGVAGLRGDRAIGVVVENELVVRRNLPAATRRVIRQLSPE